MNIHSRCNSVVDRRFPRWARDGWALRALTGEGRPGQAKPATDFDLIYEFVGGIPAGLCRGVGWWQNALMIYH